MIEKFPLVTVITAVRNNKEGIRKTLESIFSQTYSNLEVIVIDGASTDGTMEVVREYADKIDYAVSEPDKGVYDAMNKGIAASHGDFVNFMNSGDTFHAPDVIEAMRLEEIENPNTLVYGDTSVTYFDGTYRERPAEFFKTRMKFKGVGICHQTMFFPGQELRQRRYDLSYRIVADYALVYDLWQSGTLFLYRPLIVADYEWGSGISSDPYGLIKVYRENARVARQQWNPLYWAKILLEYWRLWRKKVTSESETYGCNE